MSAVITILLSALAILFILLLVVLATPVQFDIRLRKDGETSFRVVARPLGGAGPPLPLADSGKKRAGKPAKQTKPAKTPKTGKKRWRGRGPDALLALPDLMSGLLRCIRVRSLSLDAEFGLSDPADTGYVFGMLTPLIYGRPPRAAVSVRPVFEGSFLRAVLDARISVTPIALAWPFLRFGWRIFGPFR